MSNQNSLAVVDLVLDDLRCPAGEGLEPCLELLILPLHLDSPEAFCLPGAGVGQAALLGLIGSGSLNNDRIEHDHVFTLVVKDDDAFVDAVAAIPTQPPLWAINVSSRS